MPIQVRLATIETRREFSSLLDEANAWQQARGSQGWTGPFDDHWMLPRISEANYFSPTRARRWLPRSAYL